MYDDQNCHIFIDVTIILCQLTFIRDKLGQTSHFCLLLHYFKFTPIVHIYLRDNYLYFNIQKHEFYLALE